MSVLFTYAFRPLFLLATIHAILIVPFWVAAWLGMHSAPTGFGTPVWWHAHEMIFGFAGAAVGGFALTAVATWTKRPPVAGLPLVILTSLWLFARVLFFLPGDDLLLPAAVADLGYDVLLLALMSREIVATRNARNYKVLAILALFAVANALFFTGLRTNVPWVPLTLFGGLWLLVLLINLIGGRIIPGFTRNWLKRQAPAERDDPSKLPPAFDRFDLVATWLLLAFAASQLTAAPARPSAVLGLLTALALLFRLVRWRGWRTTSEPLVWILHLAFAWIPIGIALLSAAGLGWVPRTAGIHALTGGAISTMIVAVASRAALGHTGRALQSHWLLTLAYLAITLAAGCRVASAFGPGARMLLMISATAWTLGFLFFVMRYVPILTQPKKTRPGSLPTV